MYSKSILMPHSCQKIGWWLLLLTVLIVVAKIIVLYTTHSIDVVWYLAKSSHLILIASLFFITLSKERVEDEMIRTAAEGPGANRLCVFRSFPAPEPCAGISFARFVYE